MKRASVFDRDGLWYFQPTSRTVTGLWIYTPPVVQLDKAASPQQKYEAAIQVLNACKHGLPVPDPNESHFSELLEVAKVGSWSVFAKKAKCIGVAMENDQIIVTPWQKMKRYKGAFEPVPEKAIIMPANSSPEEVGAAIEEAMSRCE
jgi:hypothetical protein